MANEIIGDPLINNPPPSTFGLLLTTGNPPWGSLVSFYTRFAIILRMGLADANIPATDYFLYDTPTLHLTVATLHKFTFPTNNSIAITAAWKGVLIKMKSSPKWSRIDSTRLEMVQAKVHEDGVGVLYLSDPDGTISGIRSLLAETIQNPRTKSILFESHSSIDAFRIPTILHMTILRWRSTPTVSVLKLQGIFDAAFAKARGHDATVRVREIVLSRETGIYMTAHDRLLAMELATIDDGDAPAKDEGS